MEQIYSYNYNCFEVIFDSKTTEVGELLWKTISYLKELGKKVYFKGFNKNESPIVEVDGENYIFTRIKYYQYGARFIRDTENEEINDMDEVVYEISDKENE